MGTTVEPKGRMTKPLHTPYSVGDTVRLVIEDDESEKVRVRLGDVGKIRRIRPAAPGDGDQTFLIFDVQWVDAGCIWPSGPGRGDRPSEIEPVARSVYTARRAAKKLGALARRLADAGADLAPLEASLDQVTQRIEADTAWLRRQLDALDSGSDNSSGDKDDV